MFATTLGHYVATGAIASGDLIAARVRVIDVVGCFLASSRLGLHQPVRDCLTAGTTGVWDGGRATVADAALYAGTVAHHLDMDDSRGAALVPVAIGLGATRGRSIDEVCAALVIGYEVMAAINEAASEPIERAHLHPPAIMMTVGSAAVAARLLRLPADQAAYAIAIAAGDAPLAPFESFTSGAAIKDLYAGWPAATGIRSAEQAASGAVGDLAVFDQGWGLIFGIDAAAWATEQIGTRSAVRSVAYKAYSACRAVHPAIAALTKVVKPIDVRDIAAITVGTYGYAVAIHQAADPVTPVGARASIAYAVAAYLMDGDLGPDQFRPDRVADSVLHDLAARVTVVEDPAFDHPRVRGAWLTINGGDRFTAPSSRWAADNPATADDIRGKFERLVGSPDLADWILAAPGETPIAQLQQRMVDACVVGPSQQMPRPRQGRSLLDDLLEAGSGLADAIRQRFGPGMAARSIDPQPFISALTTAYEASLPANRKDALGIAAVLSPLRPTSLDSARRAGGWAARLAAAGVSGPPRVFDGPRGLATLFGPLPGVA